MRAYEFMDEVKKRRNWLPSDPKAIELYGKKYELLKKRAEWLGKQEDLKNKVKKVNEKDGKIVKGMAKDALRRRQVGIYGSREGVTD